MFAARKISFSIRVQPFANLAAAAIVLIAPFLLSVLYLQSTQSKTKHLVQPIKTELRIGLEKHAALRKQDPTDTDRRICQQQFGRRGAIPSAVGGGPATDSLAVALKNYDTNICSLLRQMKGANDLATSELVMITACSLAMLFFVAILYSRLIPIAFILVAVLAIVRGYFANRFVTEEYLDKASVQNIFARTILEEAKKAGLIPGEEILQAFNNSVQFVGQFGWTTVAFLFFALACLCLRGNGPHWYSVAELRRRRNTILFVGIVISLLYSIALFRIHTLVFWGFDLIGLDNGQGPITLLLVNVGDSYVQSAAILFSLEIIVILGVAILCLNQDINRAARWNESAREAGSVQQWRQTQHLTLNYTKILTPFISAIPVFSSMFLKFLNSFEHVQRLAE